MPTGSTGAYLLRIGMVRSGTFPAVGSRRKGVPTVASGNGQANGHVLTAEVDPDLLPSHNLEAERSLLGSILHDPEGLALIVDFLAPGDFWRDSHQIIFQA